MRPAARRALTRLALPLAAALAAGLGLHALAARGLLDGACPYGGSATPAQIDARRAEWLSPLRAGERAPARPAAGFILERTDRIQIETWATANGLACAGEASGTALRCEARCPGQMRDVYARFDAAGRLVAVDVMSPGLDAAAALARFEAAAGRLAAELGAPAAAAGEATREHLDRPLRRVAVQYRFADYAADVSAIHMGQDGVVVREQYRAIPAAPGGG